MSREFRCDPKEYCGNARCCNGFVKENPFVGVTDYLRMSNFLGKSMVDIWLNKGAVYLTDSTIGPEGFRLHFDLSLIYNPCANLTEDNLCSVQDAKPFVCSAFPLMYYRKWRHESWLADFPCLRDLKPTLKQKRLAERLSNLNSRQLAIEDELFWHYQRPVIKLVTLKDYFDLLDLALMFQQERDPSMSSDRSKKLLAAIKQGNPFGGKQLGDRIQKVDFVDSFRDDVREFATLIESAIYSVLQDQIADQLDNPNSLFLRRVDIFEEEWALLKKDLAEEGF